MHIPIPFYNFFGIDMPCTTEYGNQSPTLSNVRQPTATTSPLAADRMIASKSAMLLTMSSPEIS